ncbi:nucleoside phosphatase family-domain-containing protein [Entophlyctis helioformis]|nr:nucleoside phosphatase family-domain-containing protein [Entophlyctis helioformis]
MQRLRSGSNGSSGSSSSSGRGGMAGRAGGILGSGPHRISVAGSIGSFVSDMLSPRGLFYTLAGLGLAYLALQGPPAVTDTDTNASVAAVAGPASPDAAKLLQPAVPVAPAGPARPAPPPTQPPTQPQAQAVPALPQPATPATPATAVTATAFAIEASAQCSKPASADRPSIQYALIIDAGSTGSRIHVYRFNYCNGLQPTLEDEVFEQLKPGLSSFKDPDAAAASLDPLLKIALANVPASLHRCTPVTVKATAGLRMLGRELSDSILAGVRAKLETVYPFPVIKTDGVVVMEGRDEGVFAWITVNYLLGNIGAETRKPTAAILDLGGGSTQIVFEPAADALGAEGMPAGDHRVNLPFGGIQYVLYQHSYDGYGLRAGRKAVLAGSLDNDAAVKAPKDGTPAPCVLPGREKESLAELPSAKGSILGTANGFSSCSTFMVDRLFDKSAATCKLIKPCSFDGVYMPPLDQTFGSNDMYAFSYFYDMYAEPFDAITTGFVVDDLQKAADKVCRGETDGLLPAGKAMFKENAHWCMDLTFMHQLLSTGYSLPPKRPMKTAKKIQGIETGWALGAAIQILDGLMTAGGKNGACAAPK